MGRTERGSWYRYEIIADEAVRPAHLVPLAQSLVAWASRDLDLTPPLTLVWFTRHRQMYPVPASLLPGGSGALTDKERVELFLNMDAPPQLQGRFMASTPSTIYVRALREAHYVAMNLLHEARHAWQYATGTFGRSLSDRRLDLDAEAYVKRTYLSVVPMIRQHIPPDLRRGRKRGDGAPRGGKTGGRRATRGREGGAG